MFNHPFGWAAALPRSVGRPTSGRLHLPRNNNLFHGVYIYNNQQVMQHCSAPGLRTPNNALPASKCRCKCTGYWAFTSPLHRASILPASMLPDGERLEPRSCTLQGVCGLRLHHLVLHLHTNGAIPAENCTSPAPANSPYHQCAVDQPAATADGVDCKAKQNQHHCKCHGSTRQRHSRCHGRHALHQRHLHGDHDCSQSPLTDVATLVLEPPLHSAHTTPNKARLYVNLLHELYSCIDPPAKHCINPCHSSYRPLMLDRLLSL